MLAVLFRGGSCPQRLIHEERLGRAWPDDEQYSDHQIDDYVHNRVLRRSGQGTQRNHGAQCLIKA